jgi:hypothetical protein
MATIHRSTEFRLAVDHLVEGRWPAAGAAIVARVRSGAGQNLRQQRSAGMSNVRVSGRHFIWRDTLRGHDSYRFRASRRIVIFVDSGSAARARAT